MTDVIMVALERRSRLEAEIVRLNEFVLMARELKEWGEGRRLLPAVNLVSSAPRAVAARIEGSRGATQVAPEATSQAGPAGTHGTSGSPASGDDIGSIEARLARVRERIAQAYSARGHAVSVRSQALAIRYDETSTSIMAPDQVERLRDRVLTLIDSFRGHVSRRGRIGGFLSWVAETAGRAFRDDETATSDFAGLAWAGTGGAGTVVDLHSRARPSPRPVDALVGQRLRQQRWMNGLTRDQLAGLAGVESGEIAGYESGEDALVASRLWEIAAALKVPVTYFFEGAPAEAGDKGDTRGEILADDEAMELVRAYYAIPEDRRRRLWDLARMLRQAA